MARVGKSGKISCPSRLHEQTRGVVDRKSTGIGHQHHCWIVELERDALKLYSKRDSRLQEAAIPLTVYERCITNESCSANVDYEWREEIHVSYVQGSECADRALEFRARLSISMCDTLTDAALRFARRRKYWRDRNSDWWPKVVELSRPFSSIPLA
jgi:hypothetical protein